MSDGVSVATSNNSSTASGLTTRVVRGTLWSAGGQGVTLLASFIATPFIIRLAGSEVYGVLALLNVFVGYLTFADMGMGIASTRFAADSHARSDGAESAVIWTSLAVTVVPTFMVAAALSIGAGPIVRQALQLPANLQADAITAIRLASVIFAARAITGVLNTPQLVRLRLDLHTFITTGTSVAQTCLVPVALAFGGKLVAAATVMAAVAIVSMLIQAAVSLRLLPQLKRPQIDRARVGPLVRFGGAVVVTSLVGVLLLNAEKLLLARFASVTALAHYTVAYSLAALLTIAPFAMNQSLFPAFSRLQGPGDREPLERLYTRALRGNLLWLAPTAVLLCVAAKPFFTLWAGAEYGRESVRPFYILMIGLTFSVLAHVPYCLIMAKGRANLIARYNTIELLPYILTAAMLASGYGATGAAIAWSLLATLNTILLFVFARRIAGVRFSPLPANWKPYGLAIAILLLPLISIENGYDSLMLRAILTFISMTAYAVVTWGWALSGEERAWLNNLVFGRLRVFAGNRA
jgi:O-antigen/teichoic acid export membrane protein